MPMFKIHTASVPLPISNLFILNNLHHNYNTRQKKKIYIHKSEKNENSYKLFSFHGINIWNHISKKNQTDVSYACYKIMSKKYLKSNIIPYRI